MPALSGEVRSTLSDANGQPVFTVYEFFTVGTGVLRNATVNTSDGPKTGALVVDNQTTLAQRVAVRDAAGNESRAFNVPAAGLVRSAAQLSAVGVTTIQDLAGLTLTLA